jgi:hypothetical protein
MPSRTRCHPFVLAAPQAVRTRLAGAVQELARMAKAQREMGACLDALRLLLQRMASGSADGDDAADDSARPAAGPGVQEPAAR